MSRTKTLSIALLGAAVLFVTSCGGGSDGSASPMTGSGTPTARATSPQQKLPNHGAPPVADPLSIASIKQDICSAMSKQQATSFAGTLIDTEVKRSSNSLKCLWEYKGDRYLLGDLSGRISLKKHYGLTRFYAQKAKGNWNVNPIGKIHGYPAVIYDAGMQDLGSCVVVVGIQNDKVYYAQAILEDGHPYSDNPCRVAKEFAGFVVQNLKKAQ